MSDSTMSNSITPKSKQSTAVHKGLIIEELYQAGMKMKLCQLKREHPHLSSEAIDELFYQWLFQPPADTEGWATLTIVDPRLKQSSSSN